MRIAISSQDWRALYVEFLDSPEWATKRRLILKRSPLCESCLQTPASEVHHLVYPQKRSGKLTLTDFVKQPSWQLRSVCRSCHQRETEART